MNEFLKKLKLIDRFTIEVSMKRQEFIEKLTAVVDPDTIGFFSNISDLFSSSKNILKGKVESDRFQLKRKNSIYRSKSTRAVATGQVEEHNGSVQIHTEINGFHWFHLPFYLLLLVFYAVIIYSFFDATNKITWIIVFFILLHASLMFGISYFAVRRSVQKMKYTLEREFFYLTKKESNIT